MRNSAFRGGAALAVLVGVILLAAAVPQTRSARGEDPPKNSDGSVTFKVHCAEIIDTNTWTLLTVSKPGKKSLVNSHEPGEDEITGLKLFPPGSTAKSVAGYYQTMLKRAGYVEGTDFKVTDGTIELFGVTQLDWGSGHSHLLVNGDINDGPLPDSGEQEPAEPPTSKTIALERTSPGQSGHVVISALGLEWDSEAEAVSSSLSIAPVAFQASDTSAEVIETMHLKLQELGWQASIDLDGRLVIEKNDRGSDVYVLRCAVRYDESSVDASVRDHWVLEAE